MSLSDWAWTCVVVALWALATFSPDVHPVEVKVQHKSRLTNKVTSHVEQVATNNVCVAAANKIRAQATGRVVIWCDGRRV